MKKSPYDRERFFEKYSQMDRSRLGLAGAGEWESLEPPPGLRREESAGFLGRGYGWHCIYAAEHGAAAVTGVDLSEKMLARGPGKDHGSAGDLYPGGYGGDPIPAGEL